MGLKDDIQKEVDRRMAERSRAKAMNRIIVSQQSDKLGRLSDDKTKVLLSTGEEKDAVLQGDPNKIDTCINITSDTALINNDFVYAINDDVSGNVLLIQEKNSVQENVRYWVKDILLDTLWPIDVHAVTGIPFINGLSQIQTVKFSPDGKHIFCGAVQGGEPELAKTTLKWGYIRDFTLDMLLGDPVINGTIVQGSYVLDTEGLAGFDEIPPPSDCDVSWVQPREWEFYVLLSRVERGP